MARVVLDVPGGAKTINRTDAALRQLVARNQVPFRKVGSRIIFFEDELLEWLDSKPGVRLEELEETVG